MNPSTAFGGPPPFNKGGLAIKNIPITAKSYKNVTFVIIFQYFCKKDVDIWFLVCYIMDVINVTNWLKSL